MNNEKPNNKYIITYTNQFYFDGLRFAFRKKELFDITNLPIHIPFNLKSNCWIINRKQLTKSKAKELIKNDPISVDVTDWQWYQQINFDEVFNLTKTQ